MAQIVDYYSETNATDNSSSIVGQSFTGDGGVLNSVKFHLVKSGSPTGSVYAKIYSHSGTFGTSSIPNTLLATSDAIDASTIGTSASLITFNFSGANKITLENGVKYVVVFENGVSSSPNFIYCSRDGTSPTHAGNYTWYSGGWYYDASLDLCFYVYKDSSSASQSPSASLSPSASRSASQSSSASQSPSASVSPSSSPSKSLSPSSSLSPSASTSRSSSSSSSSSPSPIAPFFGVKIAKPGIDVLNTQEPEDLIFSSDYGTLKYFDKQTDSFTINAADGDVAGTTTITHNLGYYPFVEVFVNVYIGESDGTYEYCPFAGSGATVQYDANYKITKTGVTLYGQINGVSSSLWHFDFLVFIFKNNLQLG